MDKLKALKTLIDKTNQRLGFAPASPTEFNELIISIFNQTGRTISQSTIKRLWGYIDYEGFPSATTLNILAQYNGYKDWNAYLLKSASPDSDEDSGFMEDTVIDATKIKEGEKLRLKWHPNKSCEIECIAPLRFRINKSQNIKLMAGDTLTFRTISIGMPLFFSDIMRDHTLIPAYVGAKKGGLQAVLRL